LSWFALSEDEESLDEVSDDCDQSLDESEEWFSSDESTFEVDWSDSCQLEDELGSSEEAESADSECEFHWSLFEVEALSEDESDFEEL
jgi:hypothetical protein